MVKAIYDFFFSIYTLILGTPIQKVMLFGLLTILFIIDKLFLDQRISGIVVNTFRAIIGILKKMNNWRGRLAVVLTWLAISGSGIYLVGLVLGNPYLKGLGIFVYGVWLLPLTPLMWITIGLALIVQRFLFFDKSVKGSEIVKVFKQAFKGGKDKNDT